MQLILSRAGIGHDSVHIHIVVERQWIWRGCVYGRGCEEMTTVDFASVYKEVFPFWNEIPQEDRDELCRNTDAVDYEKGRSVHSGDECSGVILVRAGSLRLYMMSDAGKDITLYRLQEGELCMLSASCLLSAITFDVFVDAEEDSACYVINGAVFAAAAERNPKMKIFMLEAVVSRFSDVMWVMQQILFMSMDRRLAIFLTDESARTGSDTIALTHGQIACYMGSAREVVSRMLKYFASEGIVEVSRKGIKILDKARLRGLAM